MLWSGDILFEGTVDTLEMLRSKGEFSESQLQPMKSTSELMHSTGKRLVFVTNNSTKSRADYKKKLESMGIPATVVRSPSLPRSTLPFPTTPRLTKPIEPNFLLSSRKKYSTPPTAPQSTSPDSSLSQQTNAPYSSWAKPASSKN